MNLKDIMRADVNRVFMHSDASGVFDEHAEEVWLYPGHDKERRILIPAIVVPDNLEGSREAYGDGIVLDRGNNGLAERRSVIFEFPRHVVLKPNSPQVGFTAYLPESGAAGSTATATRGTATHTGLIRDIVRQIQRPAWGAMDTDDLPDSVKYDGDVFVILKITGQDSNMISCLASNRIDVGTHIPKGQ